MYMIRALILSRACIHTVYKQHNISMSIILNMYLITYNVFEKTIIHSVMRHIWYFDKHRQIEILSEDLGWRVCSTYFTFKVETFLRI